MQNKIQKSITVNTITELPLAAKEVLQFCGDTKLLAFYGQMGAGKTTLIKAICEILDVEDVASSPTFSIVNEYRSEKGEKIYHFDFYRIKSVNEAYDMGYEDYFYSGNYCFIEWPDKITELLPEHYMKVDIQVDKEKRLITISNH